MVNLIQLNLYLEEDSKHNGKPLYDWVIECAKLVGVSGCTCFRSFLSYGKHQHVHSEGFFELQGKDIIRMEFISTESQIKILLDKLKEGKISCFYTKIEVESFFL